MKHIRRLTTILVCLALVFASATAMAAKVDKKFTQQPTMRLTVPSHGVESGRMNDFTVNASLPGFLTVRILDASGRVVATVYDHLEIHSKENLLDFYGCSDDGTPLTPGEYEMSFSMVSQFGVASETTNKALTVTKSTMPAVSVSAVAPAKTTAKTTAAPSAGKTTPAKTSSSGASASSQASSSKPAAAQSTVEYAESIADVGDEGLLIGVGVDDVALQEDAGFWGLTSSASDADIWAAITRKMTSVDVDEKESAYIYDSPEEGRRKIGTVSGLSQGLNLITERPDGWSLVEAFRNEDGAFVRGYIRTNKLQTVEPNALYGIVIDKASQTLTVFKEGTRLGSCQICTGLPTAKYLHRETPAGEFITVTRRGTVEYYGMGYSKYAVRINGNFLISEIPTTKKNGSDFSVIGENLGQKATRGNICLAHEASTDGGINAEWIWNMTDENKRVKVLIFDDKDRSDVPQGI